MAAGRLAAPLLVAMSVGCGSSASPPAGESIVDEGGAATETGPGSTADASTPVSSDGAAAADAPRGDGAPDGAPGDAGAPTPSRLRGVTVDD
jgi:hypothetical protein